MKTLIATLILISGTANASIEKYTEVDYNRLTKDEAVRVKVVRNAKKNLNYFGSSCAKAALASVISKSFALAEDDGVDYPENIDITNVLVAQPVPWINILHIQSGATTFSVTVHPSSIPCTGDEAKVQ